MENPEEILHSLEEFSKLKPKSIPHELEEYLCFVAKTGDPVYQWSTIKCLFREKLLNVITEFYESCPTVDIPHCRNVDYFQYDTMKAFILEKLDTFVAAPFTVQRICELLTTPRKEYNRIDKYMRALEKNILVVSTTEPGNHRAAENGDGFVNGIESDHAQDSANDINIEEMDETPVVWPAKDEVVESVQSTSKTSEQPILEAFTEETVAVTAAAAEVCNVSAAETTTEESPAVTLEEPAVSVETDAEKPVEPVDSTSWSAKITIEDQEVEAVQSSSSSTWKEDIPLEALATDPFVVEDPTDLVSASIYASVPEEEEEEDEEEAKEASPSAAAECEASAMEAVESCLIEEAPFESIEPITSSSSSSEADSVNVEISKVEETAEVSAQEFTAWSADKEESEFVVATSTDGQLREEEDSVEAANVETLVDDSTLQSEDNEESDVLEESKEAEGDGQELND